MAEKKLFATVDYGDKTAAPIIDIYELPNVAGGQTFPQTKKASFQISVAGIVMDWSNKWIRVGTVRDDKFLLIGITITDDPDRIVWLTYGLEKDTIGQKIDEHIETTDINRSPMIFKNEHRGISVLKTYDYYASPRYTYEWHTFYVSETGIISLATTIPSRDGELAMFGPSQVQLKRDEFLAGNTKRHYDLATGNYLFTLQCGSTTEYYSYYGGYPQWSPDDLLLTDNYILDENRGDPETWNGFAVYDATNGAFVKKIPNFSHSLDPTEEIYKHERDLTYPPIWIDNTTVLAHIRLDGLAFGVTEDPNPGYTDVLELILYDVVNEVEISRFAGPLSMGGWNAAKYDYPVQLDASHFDASHVLLFYSEESVADPTKEHNYYNLLSLDTGAIETIDFDLQPTTLPYFFTFQNFDLLYDGSVTFDVDVSGSMTITETLHFDGSDAVAVSVSASGSLTTEIEGAGGAISPDDVYGARVFVANANTQMHSEYTNWTALALEEFAGKRILNLQDGLYVVEGTDDDGAQIDSKIYWAPSELGSPVLKILDMVIVNQRGDAANVIMIADDNQKRVSSLRAGAGNGNIEPRRADTVQALEGRYWQIGYENDGNDFEIDQITVVPVNLSKLIRR